jgi:Cu/Ag efflux pump CusA
LSRDIGSRSARILDYRFLRATHVPIGRSQASRYSDEREPGGADAAGYGVEYGGQFESQRSASRRLAVLFVGVIAGLFMLLILAFVRSRDAIIVMVNLPLALIGGVVGVFLAGGVLSIAAMIGFITLFGIATRNGIMLVSHIQQLMREEG